MTGSRSGGLSAGILLTVVLTGCGGHGQVPVPDPPAQGDVLDAAGVLTDGQEADPEFHLTDEQREACRKYRCSKRGKDHVSNPAAWLPLYMADPALYSGASSGSSYNGGGGFSGGGASGSY